MKALKQFTLGLIIIFTTAVQAQGINYKALIKDGDDNVLTNQKITVQYTILQGVALKIQYQETHTPTTDANGIIIVNIGEGSPTSGVFSDIDWARDTHSLKTEINTGDGLVDMGTTQFKAVPYALSTVNAVTKIDGLIDGKSDSDGTNDGSSVFIGINAGLNDDSTDNGNVGIGFNALYANTTGSNNTANGDRALYSNTTGIGNTANGSFALLFNTIGHFNTANGSLALYFNTTGIENTANGGSALYSNTTGSNNTANGYGALRSNTEGNKNAANGFQALYSNMEGDGNTANGDRALYSNTTGDFNTANGGSALYSNTTGDFNTANGISALFSNMGGGGNTAIGTSALSDNTSGYNNTAIGVSALLFNTTGGNNTGIGAGAYFLDGTASNQVRIGNTLVQYASIQVDWSITSDKYWKENIRALPYGLDVILQLKPVDYVRKNNDNKTREIGFIAQDIEALLTKIGYKDQGFLTKSDKGLMSLRYNDFIGLLTRAIQEQQEIIEKQNNEIKSLTSELGESKTEQSTFNKRLSQLEKLFNTSNF